MKVVSGLLKFLLTENDAPWNKGNAAENVFEVIFSGSLAAIAALVMKSHNIFAQPTPGIVLYLGLAAPFFLSFFLSASGLKPSVGSVTSTTVWLVRMLSIHFLLLAVFAYIAGQLFDDAFVERYEALPDHEEIYEFMPWWTWVECSMAITFIMIFTVVYSVWRPAPDETLSDEERRQKQRATLKAFTGSVLLYLGTLVILRLTGVMIPITPWWVQPPVTA